MNATGKPDDDVVTVDRFAGLRNTVGPESFELGDLDRGENVDVTDALKLRRRKGFSNVLVAGAYHSLYASQKVMVAGIGATLARVFIDGTTPSTATLRSGLAGGRIAYAAVGPRIYYTDGQITGCIDGGTPRSWGIEPPSSQPAADAMGGALLAGTYQYAVTYLRVDGQESGTGASGTITLPAGGGISFRAIPVSSDPDVVAKRLYVSPVNGDALLRVMELPANAVAAQYTVAALGTAPLATQHLQPPIAGQLLLDHSGRVYVARGRRLYHTPAYSPELMDVRRSFPMPSFITLAAEVDDGIYVGTADEIIFLAGDDPAKFVYSPKLTYGAILGVVAYANAEDIDPSQKGIAAIVGTAQGVCACLNGGIIINLTKERFQYPATERGAGVVRSHGGMSQYLMVLEGTEGAANTAF